MAHEYLDSDEVLKRKVAVLADLVRRSRRMLCFTGAGISTSAGIDDYASKAKGASVTAAGRSVVKDWKDAAPTRAHRVLAAMHEAGHLKHWIQQNHDSLPQKAGYPQHALNEIHGSLHDPANPIVPYEGSLREDLYEWMREWEDANDLCLALGTSLSGFNVDRVAETAADRAERGASLGLVIVNLQATPYDARCALRVFARIDRVMELLAVELGIAHLVRTDAAGADNAAGRAHDAAEADAAATGSTSNAAAHADAATGQAGAAAVATASVGSESEPGVFKVPFDRSGAPARDGGCMEWDLRLGARVRLTGGPYEGDVGTIVERSAAGHVRIRFEESIHPVFQVKRRPFSLWLGSWWVGEATRGFGITPGGKIPLVNV